MDDFGENLYFFKRTTPWQNTNLVPRVLSTDHGNEVKFLGKNLYLVVFRKVEVFHLVYRDFPRISLEYLSQSAACVSLS